MRGTSGAGQGRRGTQAWGARPGSRPQRRCWTATLLCLIAIPSTGAWAAESGLEDPLSVTGPAPKSASEPTPEPAEAPPRPEAPPGVGLDRLLQLPSSMSFDNQERSGEGSSVWRERFSKQLEKVAEARSEVGRIKLALDEAAGGGAGSQWQIAPPGSNRTETTPVSFKLREELRAGREVLEGAEKELRELEIEADLANVPPEWRN